MAAPQVPYNKPAGKEDGEGKKGVGASKQSWKQGNKQQGAQSKSQNKSGSFKGEIAKLNGNVYTLHNETSKANQFHKTTRAIAAYVNRTMKSVNNMMNLIDNMKHLDFVALMPNRPESTGDKEIDKMILKQ
jgi:hypothetical protein